MYQISAFSCGTAPQSDIIDRRTVPRSSIRCRPGSKSIDGVIAGYYLHASQAELERIDDGSGNLGRISSTSFSSRIGTYNATATPTDYKCGNRERPGDQFDQTIRCFRCYCSTNDRLTSGIISGPNRIRQKRTIRLEPTSPLQRSREVDDAMLCTWK
jgi:hypothetical protein